MGTYLSVVVPLYNEANRITDTLNLFREYLDRQPYTYEVVLVDDGSEDATVTVVRQLTHNWPQAKLLVNAHRGKGAVVKQGILVAGGEYILFTDADNSTHIGQIEKLLPHIGEYAVVFGSRHCPGAKIMVPQGMLRIILSRLSNLLVRWLLVPGIYDTQCGFKLFQQKPAQDIFSKVTINRFGFDFEALAVADRLGYKFKEVGVEWHNAGESKVRAGRDALRTLSDLFRVKLNLWRGVYFDKKPPVKVSASE